MTTLGKYEVLAEIGTGSMGVIYRARDPILDREVALKTIAGSGGLDPELKERFYREARAGARLHHPNVVTVYELGEQEGMLFIALELLSGSDLRQFILERRALPVNEKIEIMAAVCEGLQHAHDEGIVHRDIKPSNIFLTAGNVGKILDFGVARLSASKLTMMGRVLGTPFYMAPEQILGKPCDGRSDIFSLALVAFEFISYSHPFAGESIPKRIINDAPDSLVERNPEVPPELEPVIARALAKDPNQRYARADEFARALRGVLAGTRGSGTYATISPPQTAPVPQQAVPQYANTEFKMSAILSALQEFDAAIEAGNIPVARTALETVERLAKTDDRFATAAKESRTRFNEIEARMPAAPAPAYSAPRPAPTPIPVSVQPPPAPAPIRTTPIPTPSSESWRPAPVAPAGPSTPEQAPLSDATSFFGGGPLPPATNPPAPRTTGSNPAYPSAPQFPGTAPDRTGTQIPVAPSIPNPAAAPVTPKPSTGPSKTGTMLMVGGAVAVFIVVLALVAYFLTQPKAAVRMPAVATAEVAVAKTHLLDAPADSANVVVDLKKGDVVNVIHPPHSRSQDYTEVQYIAGNHVYQAGAMKTSELTNWKSAKPDVALFLIEAFAPQDGASDSDLRDYSQKLSAFMARFPGTPEQTQAQAELDKTNAALNHPTTPDVTPTTPTTPPVQVPATPATPVFDANVYMARAQKAWEDGNYAQAEKLLRQVLQQKPGLAAAQQLLDRVEKAKKLEGHP